MRSAADIRKKIDDIIENEKAYYQSNSSKIDFQREVSKSTFDQEGRAHYYTNRKLDLIQKIEKESMYGFSWVAEGCNFEKIDIEWIQKKTVVLLNHLDESNVWNQLSIFFREFIKLLTFERLIKQSNGIGNPILEKELLGAIYWKYKEFFVESQEKWISRFVPDGPIEKIEISSTAKAGSSRYVLLAILEFVHLRYKSPTGIPFNFQDFVLDRFGIPSYYDAISKRRVSKKFEPKFRDIINACEEIAKQ